MTTSLRRMLVLIAIGGLLPMLAACPKKHEEIADAEPPPAATDAAPVQIAPLDDDAGFDAGTDAKPHTGPYKPVDPLASKVAACCNELTRQSKANGNPPEFAQAITMCNATAAQLKTNPNAPELNALRPLLGMLKNAPSPCRGF